MVDSDIGPNENTTGFQDPNAIGTYAIVTPNGSAAVLPGPFGKNTAGTTTGGLQEAANALATAGGGTLFHYGGPGSTTSITTTFELKNTVSYKGDGVIIQGSGGLTTIVKTDATTAYGSTTTNPAIQQARRIEQMCVDGNQQAGTTGFLANGCVDTYFDLNVSNCGTAGIGVKFTVLASGVSRGLSGQIRTVNCGTGVQFVGAAGQQVTNSFFKLLELRNCSVIGLDYNTHVDHVNAGYVIVSNLPAGTTNFVGISFATVANTTVNNNEIQAAALTLNGADTASVGIVALQSAGNRVERMGFGSSVLKVNGAAGSGGVATVTPFVSVTGFYTYDEVAFQSYVNSITPSAATLVSPTIAAAAASVGLVGASANFINYTPDKFAGTYRITVNYRPTTTGASTSVGFTLAFKDSTGAVSLAAMAAVQDTGAGTALLRPPFLNTGATFIKLVLLFDIDNSGTAITLSSTGTFTGTTYNLSAVLERVL